VDCSFHNNNLDTNTLALLEAMPFCHGALRRIFHHLVDADPWSYGPLNSSRLTLLMVSTVYHGWPRRTSQNSASLSPPLQETLYLWPIYNANYWYSRQKKTLVKYDHPN
jgi:hypothetical protein